MNKNRKSSNLLGKRDRGKALTAVLVVIAGIVFTLLIYSCGLGYIITEGPRTYYIDFKETIFNDPAEADPEMKGLGVDTISIEITVEDSTRTPVVYDGSIRAADIIADDYDYSQIGIEIEGKLLSVVATAGNLTAVLDKESAGEGMADQFEGWTEFANTEKLKLDYSVNEAEPDQSILRLLVTPRGGSAPVVMIDAGVQAAGGVTDRGGDIATKEIALQFDFAEYPDGLEYAVFTKVVEENLAVIYNEAINFDASYLEDPWTDRWSYSEIVSDGRSVAGTLHQLTRYGSTPFDALDPLEDGKKAVLIDLSAESDEELTSKYLLVGVILYYESLSTPLDVLCIDIE